jgi:hypothetical protein
MRASSDRMAKGASRAERVAMFGHLVAAFQSVVLGIVSSVVTRARVRSVPFGDAAWPDSHVDIEDPAAACWIWKLPTGLGAGFRM